MKKEEWRAVKGYILSGHIREACRGTLKTYKGFIWRYA